MNSIWDEIKVENGNPSETILIIARSFIYVAEWCRIYEIDPRSPNIRWARNLEDFHGVSGSYYVDLGTDSQDVRELAERLKSLNAIKPFLRPNI